MISQKNILALSLSTLALGSTGFAAAPQSTTVGIVLPLEHKAMTEITQGFKDTLKKEGPSNVRIVVKNAEHDPTLEASMLKQMTENGTDIIEPVGTDAFEMAQAEAKNTAILGIATDYTDAQRLTQKNHNVSSVDDEVRPERTMALIHHALPNVHRITLIHSADNKIFNEAEATKKAAARYGIQVQDMMVSTASELYTAGQGISTSSQAIFMLKDHLIVSGTPVLAQIARQRRIPLIASDDGSVQEGAAFALGVSEYQTGVIAAEMTVDAIKKGGNLAQALASLPVRTVKPYRLFLNPKAAAAQGVNLQQLKAANRNPLLVFNQ